MSANNDSCYTLYSGKVYVRQSLMNFLIFLMASTMVINFIVNSAVMYSMAATNQLKTISLRILFSLSASDVCLSVIGQPLFLCMLITSGDKPNCKLDSSVEFAVLLFAHASAWIIVTIGFDRYFRLKYTKRYTSRVKEKHFYIAMACVLIVSIAQVDCLLFGTHFNFYPTANMISTIFDILIFIILFIPYAMTMIAVKSHVRRSINKKILGKVDRIVSSMGRRIMVAIFVMYSPYAVFTLTRVVFTNFVKDVHGIMRTEWFNFCFLLGCQIGICNSIVNAFIFFSLNKKAKRKILETLFKTYDVYDVESTSFTDRRGSSVSEHMAKYRTYTMQTGLTAPAQQD